VYISTLFLCVNAMNTVLAVFERERNMFYRHKQSLMYDSKAIIRSFTLAEMPFILLAGMIFTVCFYFLMGFAIEAYKFFLFYFFATFAIGNFTYLGQMLVSLFRDSQTAQGE